MRTSMQARLFRCIGRSLGISLLLALAGAGAAHAQLNDPELDRGPASELYIRKRPPAPEVPATPPELEKLLTSKEKQRNDKREEAIGLLKGFLDTNPQGEARADALFKLAELLWEEARRTFVNDMDRYERALEACKQKRDSCKEKPQEPRVNLAEPAALYKQIATEHPSFGRMDVVLYLVGFAAKEQNQADEALGYFQQVISRFPQSPLFGDAWMMIGEHYFANGKWEEARQAFANILERPESATYDLALFKTAWCDWKAGNADLAARRFKEVLDLAVQAEISGTSRTRRRRAQLRDEALEYLVIVFTEDRAISAKEVYDFLASIGGERYSKDVLVRVAEAYYGQSEYERSANTYRFLIEQGPTRLEAADYQRNVITAFVDALDRERVKAEMALLLESYGPNSRWAKANKLYPSRLERSLEQTERLVRETATNYHAEAQQREKADKKPNLALYQNAAEAYATYLGTFGTHAKASEVRFLRAEILYFKLQQFEAAGDEYLAVGKSKPASEAEKEKLHKDALLKAMEAFEKARPKDVSGKRELASADRKFAETVDLYATLFPADPELVGVIFRNGQLFYDYGDYDEAIKRFGLIVTKYPDDPNAGPAGDRILKALASGEDYENIESWARKLKKAKAFQNAEQQARLDRLIVESIGKSGEKYGNAGKFDKAAEFYLRIPKEFPEHQLAPQAYMNAGVMYEKAKQPESAAATYLALAERYPKSKQAEGAAFAAGKVYESVAYFERAADAYEVVVKDASRKDSNQGADALFNAGVLRQALGQHDRAIEHYTLYAKRYRERDDAPEVAFRIGVVYEEAGRDKEAYEAFAEYAKKYRKDAAGDRLVEANTRAARVALRLGNSKAAAGYLKVALKSYKKLKGKEQRNARRWAAEARYHEGELIFLQYAAITLDVKPRKLQSTLDKKTKLLDKAQSAYLDVVDYNDPQWATAALYRIGRIYEEFAESIRNAPVPPGLSEEEGQLYKEGLENYVVEVEERAIELYSTGYRKALDLKVYNTFTQQIREALGRLDSSTHPPITEARARVRFGDRPLVLAPVKEVVRDE